MAESAVEVDRFPVVVYIFSHIGHQAGVRGQFSNLGSALLEIRNFIFLPFSLCWIMVDWPVKGVKIKETVQ